MACTNPNNPECANCNKSGLAILPVRYAVVPNTIKATLPKGLGEKVTNVSLAHHHYALRTLRQGYVYLYYEKHPVFGRSRWEVYSVGPDGMLYLQTYPFSIHPVSKPMSGVCLRDNDNYPASLLAIQDPEKHGKVWIAFSDHLWTQATFNKYGSLNDAERKKRMQSFLPSQLAASGKHPQHGIEATQSNIEQVIEYQDDFDALTLDNPLPRTISKLSGNRKGAMFTGEHKPEVLNAANTIHRLHMRTNQSKKTVETMQRVSQRKDGTPYKPVIFAVWDEMGITHELNGFRNETAGYINQYQEKEVALQISAYHAINNLKASMEKHAKEKATKKVFRPYSWTKQDSEKRLKRLFGKRSLATRPAWYGFETMSSQAEYKANEERLCQLWEEDARKGADSSLAIVRQHYTYMSTPDFNKKMAEITASIDKELAKNKSPEGQRKFEAAQKGYFDDQWEDYQDNVDWDAYDKFKSRYLNFQKVSTQIIDDRTDDLLAWLTAPALVDMLTEFDEDDLDDGAVFEDAIGAAIFGINSSKKGGDQIDKWVAELKTSDPNLIWRTIARNQKQAKVELDKELQKADQSKNIAAETYDWAGYARKALSKFIGVYKKERSAESTRQKNIKASAKAGVALPTAHALALDKVMLTAGDRILNHFKALDSVSELIIQHVLAIRAYVDPTDSIKLVQARAKYEKLGRYQQLRRLYSAEAFMAADTPPIQTQQTKSLRQAWADFSQNTTTGKTAFKDARLAILIMGIEGINFAHMISDAESRGDAKTVLALSASAMTITSGLFEVASIPAKTMWGNTSITYNRIKLAGGILSTGATAIGVWIDYEEYQKHKVKGNTVVSTLYFAKVAFGTASAVLGAASSLSYAEPLLVRVLGKGAASKLAGQIGKVGGRILAREVALLGLRFITLSVGGWITVGLIALEVVIWLVTDDELEEWLSNCALGTKRLSDNAYIGVIKQNDDLIKARVEVGV